MIEDTFWIFVCILCFECVYSCLVRKCMCLMRKYIIFYVSVVNSSYLIILQHCEWPLCADLLLGNCSFGYLRLVT